MPSNRRTFLERTLAGAGGAVLGARVSAAGTRPARTTFPPKRVTLGRCGVEVSRVGLGTGVGAWMRQSHHSRMKPKQFDALVEAAWQRGVRLFDTADLYGTHAPLARALAGKPRKRYALLTKVWLQNKGLPGGDLEPAADAVKRFCKELRTDYVDIVLLHGVADKDWPKLHGDYLDDLTRLKKARVVKAVGVSIHSIEALGAAVRSDRVDVIEARINPFGLAMAEEPAEVVALLKQAHRAGKGVLAMKVIGAGRLAADPKRRTQSIRYVAGLTCVHAMVVGFERAQDMDDFAARLPASP